MTHYEVDSFLTKFKQLWIAGIEATLTIKSANGGATVALTAGLGPIPRLPHHAQHSRQHRGGSFLKQTQLKKLLKDPRSEKTS